MYEQVSVTFLYVFQTTELPIDLAFDWCDAISTSFL